ncbi:MAG: alpha-N-acetylglucosaminidase [Opitutaceae bacterium]
MPNPPDFSRDGSGKTSCFLRLTCIVAGLLLSPILIQRSMASTTPVDVARSLAQRTVPALASELEFELIPSAEGSDVFEIESLGGKIVLRGNNGVAMASALNRYLEEFGHCDISWGCGNQLVLPNPAPVVPHKIRVICPHQFRYIYNYCTHGYTMAWWDWSHWERELDFLALKGVNLALIIQGQEQVWIDALKSFGYTNAAMRQWLCLPSHLPWQYMSNMEDYGGPLPQSLVDRRLDLGLKIVARMRELGMEPVLQGYYGIVPSDFKKRYPEAKVHPQGEWDGLKRPDMLDPLDPLFPQVAAAFYKAQKQIFGDVKFLAADPFHEGGRIEGIDLAACGKAINGAMLKSNPATTWVLQSWLENPRQEMIDALDKSKLLVLDLRCEETENWRLRKQFGDTPWLWCIVQNWGGNVGLGGDMEGLRAKPARALAEAGPGKGMMRGIGALMEGSQTQPLNWEMFFRNAWHSDAPDFQVWMPDYVRRRYGVASPDALQALQIELETMYNTWPHPVESVVCARPTLESYPKACFWNSTEPRYDTTRLVEAWRQLLEASSACQGSESYRYDLTDLGRQVMADLAARYHQAILRAYERKNAAAVSQLSGKMLGLIRDLDELLATRKEFLLGVWLADARKSGVTKEEQDLCEQVARELPTTWNAKETVVVDYANRQWAGLVGTFYLARWQTWLDALQAALKSGKPVDVEATRARIADADHAWTRQRDAYPVEPRGDTVEISQRLIKKYSADASNKSFLH